LDLSTGTENMTLFFIYLGRWLNFIEWKKCWNLESQHEKW